MSTNGKFWIVTDMDDTLIKHYGNVSERIRDLWNYLSKQEENCLVVATGQSYTKVTEKFLANGLNLPDYIVSNQGTVIYRPKEEEVMRVFTLDPNKVIPIVNRFLEIGGNERFIRINALNKIVAYDCEEARRFYREDPQSNVEFTKDLLNFIQKGVYTKLVLSAPLEVVEKMLTYPAKGVTIFNSGETKYGREHYYRYEIVAGSKRLGLEYLFYLRRDFGAKTHIICLGDEISDYGLAEAALVSNLVKNCTGYFSIIDSNSKGNSHLREAVEKKARMLRLEDHLIFAPSVENDGWESAIFEWKEKLKK